MYNTAEENEKHCRLFNHVNEDKRATCDAIIDSTINDKGRLRIRTGPEHWNRDWNDIDKE